MALEVTVNEQPALYFKDERGYIMTKEKFFEMMELARVFYESENIDEWIKKENRRNRWEHHRLLSTPVVNGKRILPKPNIKEKVFKKIETEIGVSIVTGVIKKYPHKPIHRISEFMKVWILIKS